MKMQGYPKARLIIAIVTILLFVASVTVGILNIVGIIKGPWYSILFFVFAALSTTAVFQKLPSPSSEEPSKLISTTVNGQVSDINKGHVQVEGIDLGVNEFTGALVVYAKKTM